jgi:hypothetical protein
MKETVVHSFDQGIDDDNHSDVYYNSDDFEAIRSENRTAAHELMDACEGTEGDMNPFLKASLRGLEHLYQGYDEEMTLGIRLVVENQNTMSPLVLAARYAKMSKRSQAEAFQRGKEDEKVAKGCTSAPARPSRQISRAGGETPPGSLLQRKKSDRKDFCPSAPTRKTSSIISEGSSRRTR